MRTQLTRTRPILLCLPFLATTLDQARADSHAVTIVNTTSETIRRIEIGNAENRLRSSLPHGAQASITYSTGCQADVRLAFDGGRTESFAAVDVCASPRIVTGQGVVGNGATPVVGNGATPVVGNGATPVVGNGATPVVGNGATPVVGNSAAPVIGSSTPPPATAAASTATPASAKPGTKPGAKPITGPAMAPPPVVPPWTGKSITKRFGGME